MTSGFDHCSDHHHDHRHIPTTTPCTRKPRFVDIATAALI
jgi:hypothetical protein